VHIITPDKFQPMPGRINFLYCLAPDTKVLTADLEWIPVWKVMVGDELIGFDEKLGKHNCFRRSRVLGVSVLRGKAYRIRTTRGDIVASGNHMWVARNHPNSIGIRGPRNKMARRWVRTDALRPGMLLTTAFEKWEMANSYDGDWMAGFLDGEGHVSNTGNGNCVGFSQKEGPTLERACDILNQHGFTYHKNYNRISKCWGVYIRKGLRALGVFRPSRLLPKAGLMWDGVRTWSPYPIEPTEIISVEDIGEQDLVGTMTETGTLIAEGHLSHNTMYECTTLPPDWIEPINRADVIVVPCRQNRDLFRQYTKKPVELCWEGVDVEAFPFVERRMPVVSRFVYLWVGAPNPRKGFEHVGAAWDQWLHSGRMPKNAWLYCKSSGVDSGEQVKHYAQMRLSIDTRDLPVSELSSLYQQAHAFVLPSMGEGFGLTLAEAMSTGLPCIYTPWGGPRDFLDESCGYPVKWKFSKVQALKVMGPGGKRQLHSESSAAFADVNDIVRRMEQIYQGYDAALAKGRRAAKRIRDGFTWDISARSFLDIIARYERGAA
jgi:glycosyltransferase involved in cell wall biosynthesis